MLAERERLDKELAVAQMQGKFRLVVLYDTGHSIQEDDAANTAQNMYEFLTKFRIPTTTEEVALMKERGVGGFTPALKPFKKQLT
jgi:protein phosphatase methylesterase 1